MTVKKIIWITVIAGLLLTLIIFYFNLDFSSGKTQDKPKTQDKSLSMKKTPPRRMSGTFTVPAGKGPEETKIWVSRNEIIWLAATEVELFDCKTGRTIEIGPNGWTSPPTKKKGYLTFLKKPASTVVDYKIIN